MPDPIRIAVIDDHPLFRDGLAETIKGTANMRVVAQGNSAEEARHVAVAAKPDIVLLDIFIPGGGIQAARAIRQASSHAKVVMLTASDDNEHVSDAIEAGAKGYILKGVSGRELIRAVESVHAGASYITPQLATRLLMQTRGKPLVADRVELSAGELEILDHVASGLTNKEISASIGLSTRTTKRCITQIFRKLRVRNRVEALLAAQKLKLRPTS